MQSKIYVGQVRHRRFTPHEHSFSYSMFMMYLDLDELPRLFDPYLLWSSRGFNLASFNRREHLGDPQKPLKQSVKDLVLEKTGIVLTGPIRLLTHMCYFGYGFNPASFYYCFNETGSELQVIIVEVNNTPWGEQHCYILPCNNKQGAPKHQQFKLDKEFHVSPFNPMDQNYDWRFTAPQHHIAIHMENWRHSEKIFDATLSLDAQDISSTSLAKSLVQFPLMTMKVVAAIYYQALKLWLKKTPLYTHPNKITPQMTKHE